MKLPRAMTGHWLLVCTFLLVNSSCASSDPTPATGTAMLSWDASLGPDPAGYKIYQATASGAYGAPIAIVPVNITNYTVTSLEANITYFFVVTAYNSDGAESSFSNEVSKIIP